MGTYQPGDIVPCVALAQQHARDRYAHHAEAGFHLRHPAADYVCGSVRDISMFDNKLRNLNTYYVTLIYKE